MSGSKAKNTRITLDHSERLSENNKFTSKKAEYKKCILFGALF